MHKTINQARRYLARERTTKTELFGHMEALDNLYPSKVNLKALGLTLDQKVVSIFGFAPDELPFTKYCVYSGSDYEAAAKIVSKISDPREFLAEEQSAAPYIEIHRAKFKYSQFVLSYNNIKIRLRSKNPVSHYNFIIPLRGMQVIHSTDSELVVNPGEACFCSCNQLLNITRSKDHVALIASFTRAGLKHFSSGESFLTSQGADSAFNFCLDLSQKQYQSFTALMATIFKELNTTSVHISHQNMVISHLEEAIRLKVIDVFSQQGIEDNRPVGKAVLPGYMKRVIDYIEEFAHTELPLEKLVKISGVSQRSLQQGFKNAYGIGPMTYVKQLRLRKIHEVLLHPVSEDIFVGDIAAQWGFFHLSNFAKYYREVFGELPSDTLKKGYYSKNKETILS